MSTPKRVQMTRKHPWRADNPDAVIVARPSMWGNPYVAPGYGDSHRPALPEGGRAQVVQEFRTAIEANDRGEWVSGGPACPTSEGIRRNLVGLDLACWCPLEDADGNHVPCHADVLLEIANSKAAS